MGRVRVRAGGLAALVALAAAAGLAHPAALHGAGLAAKPRKPESLTRWRKVGVWAHPRVAIPIHAQPNVSSPKVGKLHSRTEDGFPEVYLVLIKQVMPDGRTWLKIAVPMRPNGTTGWVVRRAMGKLTRVRRWLMIDRRKLRARFYDHGHQLWSAPVGIGKPSTPTPNGLFWVREEFVLDNQVFYGPYAFGTSAYAKVSDWPGGGVVGVHGTSLPQLVPGRPSHGCIRMHNKDILWLAQHMPVGTPISVIH